MPTTNATCFNLKVIAVLVTTLFISAPSHAANDKDKEVVVKKNVAQTAPVLPSAASNGLQNKPGTPVVLAGSSATIPAVDETLVELVQQSPMVVTSPTTIASKVIYPDPVTTDIPALAQAQKIAPNPTLLGETISDLKRVVPNHATADSPVSTVPEPSSMAMLAIGGVALLVVRRRRSTTEKALFSTN